MNNDNGNMNDDMEEYYRKVTDYVVDRAKKEGSVPLYLKESYGGKLAMHELVYSVVSLSFQYLDYVEDNSKVYANEDEYAHIADKTGFSTDVIELIVWFKECYIMCNDCSTLVGKCPECGDDELFFRETEGVLFESHIECGGCGKQWTLEELYGWDEMD